MRKLQSSPVLAVATAAWLVATGAGMAWSMAYGRTPGTIGTTPLTWPGDEAIGRSAGRATLVLALHPACVCSQATLEQIDRLVASRPGAVDVVVLLAAYDRLPGGADVLGPALARQRHLRRIDDPGAAIAGRFGALTSGHALLYDEGGRLRFSGGLTRGRGETGDSRPLAFLRDWTAGVRPAGVATFDVFGCALAAHGAGS